MYSLAPRNFYHFITRHVFFRQFGSNVYEEKSPLMLSEVLNQLNISNGQTVLDMTFGAGLHSEAILAKSNDITLFALDRDPISFQRAKDLALKYPGQVKPLFGRFSDLPTLLRSMGVQRNSLDAILIDIGCSSIQLNEAERGFTPEKDGPLDMRMDGASVSHSITAQDILQKADEHDLSRVLKIYGEEKHAKKIAKSIISCRYTLHNLTSTFELRDFLKQICDDKPNKVVKNVFYALRTFVNNEFNELNYAMFLSAEFLKKGGRIVTLTFSQPEDTIVKRHLSGNVLENRPNPMPLKYYSQTYNLSPDETNELRRSLWSPLTKHVITASSQEIDENFRSQAAKLRSAVKV